MTFTPLSIYKPTPDLSLPLTLMILNDWSLINVIGQDSKQYLQSQITADITQIQEHQHILTAHCNYKGRIWSTLHLFYRGNGFAFIERRSVHDLQISEMRRYATFSKVDFIVDNSSVLLGVSGLQARMALSNLFNELPTENKQLINDGTNILLWFKYPLERFLLITNQEVADHITKTLLYKGALFNNSQQWLALNIESGIPTIDIDNVGLFTPQDINLQFFDGISFKKGCYIGQEIISKIKFRGISKRAMWYVTGHANCIPSIRDNLEMKIGNHWRRTGTILAAVQLDNGRLLVQVVMNNNIQINDIFRIPDDTNILHISPLPYSL